jgi:hypothetical protein
MRSQPAPRQSWPRWAAGKEEFSATDAHRCTLMGPVPLLRRLSAHQQFHGPLRGRSSWHAVICVHLCASVVPISSFLCGIAPKPWMVGTLAFARACTPDHDAVTGRWGGASGTLLSACIGAAPDVIWGASAVAIACFPASARTSHGTSEAASRHPARSSLPRLMVVGIVSYQTPPRRQPGPMPNLSSPSPRPASAPIALVSRAPAENPSPEPHAT